MKKTTTKKTEAEICSSLVQLNAAGIDIRDNFLTQRKRVEVHVNTY
ncbi:MAG TPA: hypothetical protein VNT20_09100 [Flavisolibacter sp.]|jgi:hypothetical protein|nr:hypothetical protein [Flavisolibacter sp.]